MRSSDYRLIPSERDVRQILGLCSPRGSVDGKRLRQQLDDLRVMVQGVRISWQQGWNLSFEPLHRRPETLRFDSLHDELRKLLDAIGRAPRPLNIFAHMAFQRQAAAVEANPAFDVLQAVAQMHDPLNQGCRDRTLRDPKDSQDFRDYRRAYDALQEITTIGRS